MLFSTSDIIVIFQLNDSSLNLNVTLTMRQIFLAYMRFEKDDGVVTKFFDEQILSFPLAGNYSSRDQYI